MAVTVPTIGGVDSSGFNGSLTVATGPDTAMIFLGEGGQDVGGSPVFTSITSDQADGAADFHGYYAALASPVTGTLLGCYAAWWDASAATHTITVVETDITEGDSILYEVGGLDETATDVEDQGRATNASGTSHNTGSVTTAGPALLVVVGTFSGGTGSTTPDNGDWVVDKGGNNDELLMHRIVSGAGTYDGNLTIGSARSSELVILAFKGEGGGGGGPTPSVKSVLLNSPLLNSPLIGQ